MVCYSIPPPASAQRNHSGIACKGNAMMVTWFDFFSTTGCFYHCWMFPFSVFPAAARRPVLSVCSRMSLMGKKRAGKQTKAGSKAHEDELAAWNRDSRCWKLRTVVDFSIRTGLSRIWLNFIYGPTYPWQWVDSFKLFQLNVSVSLALCLCVCVV